MAKKEIATSEVSKRIYTLRVSQVMLDRDLAEIYEVETKVLKQAVKRNIERFPEDFMFEPTKHELEILRSQIVTSSVENFYEVDARPFLRSQIGTSNVERESGGHGGSRYTPMAFTELGVAMLSSVLHSQRAIQVNIEIMRIFVQLRNEQKNFQPDLSPRLESLENMFKQRFDKLDAHFQNHAPATQTLIRQAPVNIIKHAVALHFGMQSEDLKSALRTQAISLPRQIAIYLVRKHLCMSFSEIGKHFGRRDHTTIMHAYRKILGDSEKNTLIRTAIAALQKEIQPLIL